MPLEAVVFDMDGVIVDTMQLHHAASMRVLSRVGVKLTSGDMKKLDTMRSIEAYQILMRGKTDAQIEKLLAEKYGYLKRKAAGIKAFPGFHELVFRLRGKVKMAVFSSSQRGFVEFILTEIGEPDLFPVVVCGEDVSKGKPEPEGYLKAVRLLGAKPENSVAIEDSIFGIMSAKAAGLKCVAITNTYERNFLLDADLILDSLEDISFEKLGALFNA